MTEQEYRVLVDSALIFPWQKGDYTGYCETVRKRLAFHGLTLVSEQPNPLGFYYQMILPPPRSSGGVDWLTVDDDPFSWPVPSWIVPEEET